MDSSERYRRCRCHLNEGIDTLKFNRESQSVEEVSVLSFEVVLVIANIVSVSVPADISILIDVLFCLACF